MAALDPDELLALLRCPLSRRPLRRLGAEALLSTDPATRLKYPVRDGIPVLLEEEAETLDEAAWRAAMEESGGLPAEEVGQDG